MRFLFIGSLAWLLIGPSRNAARAQEPVPTVVQSAILGTSDVKSGQGDTFNTEHGPAGFRLFTTGENYQVPEFRVEPVDLQAPLEVVSELGKVDEAAIEFGDWLGYNSTDDDTTWLVGHGDDLGIYSMESYPTLRVGEDAALTFGMGFHFIDGPIVTDLPPRLFDFQGAYHVRKVMSDRLMLDIKAGMGIFSDFEGSARKGVRFPGHAVSYYDWDAWLVSVLGVEVLDRDDVSVLPVGGVIWRPREDLILEMVFPRPKVQVKLNSSYAIYVSGELGGGTWAIERSTDVNDNATYRDLRLVLGVVDYGDDGDAFEIGWAFDRQLEYRSGIGNYQPDDGFLIRFRALY